MGTRLRIAELLRKSNHSTYWLAQQLDGVVSRTTAYRLAKNETDTLTTETIDALCRVFGCKPGDLFTRD